MASKNQYFPERTLTVEQAQQVLDQNPTDGINFLKRVDEKGEEKSFSQGTRYLSVGIKNPDGEGHVTPIIYGKDIYIVRGPQDPNAEGATKKQGRGIKQTTITISHNHSNGYGKLIRDFQHQRDARIGALEEQGYLDGYADEKKCQMYSDKYSKKANKDYRGKPFPDPKDKEQNDCRSYLTLDFNTYGDNAPQNKRGKPITIVKDFTTGRLNEETRRIEYDMALIDGKPVDHTNAHKYFTGGSIIEELYVHVGSLSCSQQGVSIQQVVREIVVSRKAIAVREMERIDNADDALLEKLNKLRAAKEAGDSAAASTPTPQEETVDNVDAAAIDAALDDI